MSRSQVISLIAGLAAAAVLVLVPVLLIIEENHRGHVTLEKVKAKVKAEGDTLDWNAFIPGPVPDDQNFYAAPHMAEWFVKHPGTARSVFFDRFNFQDTTNVLVADVTVTPPLTNGSTDRGENNLEFRYSSFGPSVFPVPMSTGSTNPADLTLPVHMEGVPLTTVVEALARIGGINYRLDKNIRFGETLTNGRIWEEPIVTYQRTNMTPRMALFDVLNRYGFQMIPQGSNDMLVTFKDARSPAIYFSPEILASIRGSLSNAIGRNVVASRGFDVLMKAPSEIKPVHIRLQSETSPRDDDMAELFSECFPAQGSKPRFRASPAGDHSVRVTMDAAMAVDYLAWSDGFGPDLAMVREALKRPYARIDGNYSDPFAIPIPDYVAIRALAQTLADRASCELMLGRPERALDDLTFLNDSRRMLEMPPEGKPMPVVTAMIDVAVSSLYVAVIANGLRLRAWREPQLMELQKQLADVDLEPFLVAALKEEPASHYCWMTTLAAKSGSGWPSKRGYGLVPGWLDFNLVNLIELERMPLKSYDLTNRTVSPKMLDQVNDQIEKFASHQTPYRLLAAIAIPNFSKAGETMAWNQTLANEARIVCALERYRLAHGVYPETLDVLVPPFIDRIPRDIIGGKPLCYRRNGDTFALYSIGWNEIDDGGISAPATNGIPDLGLQDWVWKN